MRGLSKWLLTWTCTTRGLLSPKGLKFKLTIVFIVPYILLDYDNHHQYDVLTQPVLGENCKYASSEPEELYEWLCGGEVEGGGGGYKAIRKINLKKRTWQEKLYQLLPPSRASSTPCYNQINTQHLHALKKHGLTIEHLALGSRNSVQ